MAGRRYNGVRTSVSQRGVELVEMAGKLEVGRWLVVRLYFVSAEQAWRPSATTAECQHSKEWWSVQMAEFENDVTFFIGIERSGKDANRHAIIRVSAIAVNTINWSQKDVFDSQVAFKVENADPDWLRENTSYTEIEWTSARRPAEVANDLTRWFDALTTRSRIGKNGSSYSVWRLAGWNAANDSFWLDKWLERLGIRFRAIESFAELSVRDRVRWYFAENPHLTPPDVLSLESAANYFHCRTDKFWSWSDARNVSAASLEVIQKIMGV